VCFTLKVCVLFACCKRSPVANQRTMRLLVSSLLLVVVHVSCQKPVDLRGIVLALEERNAKLVTTVAELRGHLIHLQQQYDAFGALTASRRDEQERWRRGTAEKLESLSGGRRLSSAVSTKQHGLSSGTCADPDAPALLVQGVCTCTKGILVQGRNVTKDLETLLEATMTTTSTSTSSSKSTSTSTSTSTTTTTTTSTELKTMLGDTLTVRFAYPDMDTDFRAPQQVVVEDGSSDSVSYPVPFISFEATEVVIAYNVDSEYASGVTFNGHIISGFSHQIRNYSVDAYLFTPRTVSVSNNTLAIDCTGATFTSQSHIKITLDFLTLSS